MGRWGSKGQKACFYNLINEIMIWQSLYLQNERLTFLKAWVAQECNYNSNSHKISSGKEK